MTQNKPKNNYLHSFSLRPPGLDFILHFNISRVLYYGKIEKFYCPHVITNIVIVATIVSLKSRKPNIINETNTPYCCSFHYFDVFPLSYLILSCKILIKLP